MREGPEGSRSTRDRTRGIPAVSLLVLATGWAGAQEEGKPPEEAAVDLGETIVTATRGEAQLFDVPYSAVVLDEASLRHRRIARTVPESLRRIPSILIQKTSHGQGSPYIRGFTGFHNVFLIDGIRLNNSVFRPGPNQYWNTVDPLSLERLEIVKGPSSVLYGSDAVGGAVQAVTRRRREFEPGLGWGGGLYTRYASAEASFVSRAEVEGNAGEAIGFIAGLSWKDFGDLVAGADTGRLPDTGYDEIDGDARVDARLSADLSLTAAFQSVHQEDVPRTHKTIHARPFHGTAVGSELRRDLDQDRRLAYVRLRADRPAPFLDEASLTLSYHFQGQLRDRLRGGGRRDRSGFDVHTLGASTQWRSDTPAGCLTYGAEYDRDGVESFRKDYRGGALTLREVQGPVGDDASYDLVGAYVQDEISVGPVELIPGVRYTYAAAEADRVDDPEVGGADPATPGNIISAGGRWHNVAGSLRALWHVREGWNLFAGASQGFRAPNLYDLTSFDTTSVVETPAPSLDPEWFLGLEVGVKARTPAVRGEISYWYTFIEDMIVRSPTGVEIDGVPEVRKDNVGDGFVHGIELSASWSFLEAWSAFGNFSWMDGAVDQFRMPSGEKVRKPLSRLMPLSGLLGIRCEPREGRFWVQLECEFADDQDRLALRDRTDTQRIPPGGTPGYAVFHIRGGVRATAFLTLSAAVENIGNKDYRIHGSGQNEPGTSFVIAAEARF